MNQGAVSSIIVKTPAKFSFAGVCILIKIF